MGLIKGDVTIGGNYILSWSNHDSQKSSGTHLWLLPKGAVFFDNLTYWTVMFHCSINSPSRWFNKNVPSIQAIWWFSLPFQTKQNEIVGVSSCCCTQKLSEAWLPCALPVTLALMQMETGGLIFLHPSKQPSNCFYSQDMKIKQTTKMPGSDMNLMADLKE